MTDFTARKWRGHHPTQPEDREENLGDWRIDKRKIRRSTIDDQFSPPIPYRSPSEISDRIPSNVAGIARGSINITLLLSLLPMVVPISM